MKYLFLDIGNVLVTVNMDKVFDKLVNLGLFKSKKRAMRFMGSIEGINNVGLNDISSAFDLYYSSYNDYRDYDKMKQEIIDFWCSEEVITPNKKVLDYLYKKPYPTIAILSNLGYDHLKHVYHTLHPFFNSVDSFNSCEIGLAKPQHAYFKFVSDFYQITHESILYVDDKKINLDQAMRCFNCLNPYQFDSRTQSEDELIDTIEKFVND